MKFNIGSGIQAIKLGGTVVPRAHLGDKKVFGTAPVTEAAAPTNVVATPDNTQVLLTWSAPAASPTVPTITNYVIQYSSNDGSTWVLFNTGVSATTAATITGLMNGTTYVFRVAAVNSVGTGVYSTASNTATPRTVPAAPINVQTAPGDTQTTLTWSAPANTGGAAITNYLIQYSSDNGATWDTFNTAISAAPTAVVTGLTNSANYVFRVAAVNSAGTGSYSVASIAVTPVAPVSLWAWGANGLGQLGLGTTSSSVLVPTRVGQEQWTSVSSGELHALAIRSDGSLWAWGHAASGQLGSSRPTSTSPTQITIKTQPNVKWKAIAAGGNYSLGITDAGELWACGNNGFGQLGLGTNVSGYTTLLRVSISNVAAITTGGAATFVLTNDGTLFSCGSNAFGELGSGTNSFSQRNSLVQVGDTSFKCTAISAGQDHAVVIRTNGTLWGWGNNSRGQLGTSTPTIIFPPTQIGTATWKAVACGATHTVAIRSDDTLWAWGSFSIDTFGASRSISSTPIQIGTSTWKSVAAGFSHVLAINTTGKLWAWGLASSGALGDGYTGFGFIDRPIQIGNSDWSGISAHPMGKSSYGLIKTLIETVNSPTNVVATPGDRQILLSWSVPAYSVSPPTDYLIRYSSDSGNTWTNYSDSFSAGTSLTLSSGLTLGVSYIFQVAAVNSGGTSPYSSASEPVIFAGPPAAPTLLSVTPGDGSLSVDWAAPTDSGGLPISTYVIGLSTNGGTSWSQTSSGNTADWPYSATAAILSSLLAGVQYSVRVAAVNERGTGPFSNILTGTTGGRRPNPPVNLRVYSWFDAITNEVLDLSFDDGAWVGQDETGYAAQFSINNGSTWQNLPAGTYGGYFGYDNYPTQTAIPRNTSFLFRVAAINSFGQSDWSASKAGTTPPGPVRTFALDSREQSSLRYSWVPPNIGGNATIVDYIIKIQEGGKLNSDDWSFTTGQRLQNNGGITVTPVISVITNTATAVQMQISNLTPGTLYAVAVLAVNSGRTTNSIYTLRQNFAGYGPSSNAITATPLSGSTPPTWPSAPTAVVGQPVGVIDDRGFRLGRDSVNLSWTTPANNGGLEITGYVVQYSLNSTNWFNSADYVNFNASDLRPPPLPATTTCKVSGLTPMQAYVFRVAAFNEVGTGPFSTVSSSVTPTELPSEPLNFSAAANNGQVLLSWNPPAANSNVAAILGYNVEYRPTNQNPVAWIKYGNTATRSATVSGLTNGVSYSFRVFAVNSAGQGTQSVTLTATPATTTLTVPGAPPDKSIFVGFRPGPGAGAAQQLMWAPPVNNGGSTITAYVVTWYENGVAQEPTQRIAIAEFDGGVASVVENLYWITIPLLQFSSTPPYRRAEIRAENAFGLGPPVSSQNVRQLLGPSFPNYTVTSVSPGVFSVRVVETDRLYLIESVVLEFSADNWVTSQKVQSSGTAQQRTISADAAGLILKDTLYSYRIYLKIDSSRYVTGSGALNFDVQTFADHTGSFLVPLSIPLTGVSNVVARPTVNSIVLTWAASTDSSVTGYVIKYREPKAPTVEKFITVSGRTTTTYTLSGTTFSAAANNLTIYSPFFISLAASNSLGTGPYIEANTSSGAATSQIAVSTSTNPAAPIEPIVYGTQAGSVTLEFDLSAAYYGSETLPNTNFPAYSYRVLFTTRPVPPSGSPTPATPAWADGGWTDANNTTYMTQQTLNSLPSTANMPFNARRVVALKNLDQNLLYAFIVVASRTNFAYDRNPGTASKWIRPIAAPPPTSPPGTLPQDAIWPSVAFGNGRFVAIGSGTQSPVTGMFTANTAAAISIDGIMWTQTALPENATWKSVAFGNGVFAAVGLAYAAPVATSPDGITWTTRTPPFTTLLPDYIDLRYVAYGNGVFVAVSENGAYVVTSSDGITWTKRTVTLLPDSLTNFTFAKDKFIASGLYGFSTSSNGVTWQRYDRPVAPGEIFSLVSSIAYGNNTFVAIPSVTNSTGYATSTNGTTWTVRTQLPAPDAGVGWKFIAYGNGIFLIVHGGTTNVVLTSTDGLTWTRRTLGASSIWSGFAHGNNTFVLTGRPNIAAVYATVALAPSAPLDLRVMPGNAQVSLFWAAPSNDNGAAITNYVVEARRQINQTWVTFTIPEVFTGTSAVVTGLSNDTTYVFRVAARNSVGTGPFAETQPTITSDTITALVVDRVATSPSSLSRLLLAPSLSDATLIGVNSIHGLVYKFIDLQLSQTIPVLSVVQLKDATTAGSPAAPSSSSENDWYNVYSLQATSPPQLGKINVTSLTLSTLRTLSTTTATPSKLFVSVTSSSNSGANVVGRAFVSFSLSTRIEIVPFPTGSSTFIQTDNVVQASLIGIDSVNNRGFLQNVGGAAGQELKVIGLTATAAGQTAVPIATVEKPVGSSNIGSFTGKISFSTAYIFLLYTNAIGVFSRSTYAHVKTIYKLSPTDTTTAFEDLFCDDIYLYVVERKGINAVNVVPGTVYVVALNTLTTIKTGNISDTSAIPANPILNNLSKIVVDNNLAYIVANNSYIVVVNLWLVRPEAPTNLTATASATSVSLSWTAPFDIAAAPLTDYIVQYSSDSGATWTTFNDSVSTASSATVTGLTTAINYLFRVAAVNSVGAGPYSTSVSSTLTSFKLLFTWGGNQNGQLGNGTTTIASQLGVLSPTQIGTANWVSVDAGYVHTAAISFNKRLWTWGHNFWGQLGDGTTTRKTVPTQIGTDDWKQVACSYDFTLAIRSDDTLWGWGRNNLGQLGDGTPTQKTVPTQIGTGTWRKVTCGDNLSVAISSNGTLWAWGQSPVGDGTRNSRLTPVQISTDTFWVDIACDVSAAFGIRLDGSLWGWMSSGSGMDPAGQFSEYLTPTQFLTGKTWKKISASNSAAAAIDSDGSLWVWGSNYFGLQADGSAWPSDGTGGYFSPYAAHVVLTAVTSVSVGRYHISAIRSDGSLWAWGFNGTNPSPAPVDHAHAGALGDGTVINRLTPIKIGVRTDWADVSAGGTHTVATRKQLPVPAEVRISSLEVDVLTQLPVIEEVRVSSLEVDVLTQLPVIEEVRVSSLEVDVLTQLPVIEEVRVSSLEVDVLTQLPVIEEVRVSSLEVDVLTHL